MTRAERRIARTQRRALPRPAGQLKSIPAWYEGQDANGEHDHFVSRDEAEKLKASGDARSIHSGKGLLLKSSKPLPQPERRAVSSGTSWRVVNQTAKPINFHKPSRFGPGCPQYAFV